MDFATIILISLGLAMDCFAVSVACAGNVRAVKIWRFLLPAVSFGLFQSCMFLAGILVGEGLGRFIASFDHWAAFILLVIIGLKMIKPKKSQEWEKDECVLDNPYVLLILSFATSIDALIVGFGAGLLNGDMFLSSFIIGFTSFLMTLVGMAAGKKLGARIGRKALILGGSLLILLGVKILMSHIYNLS